MRYCGVGAKYEEVIIKGNLDELKVIQIQPFDHLIPRLALKSLFQFIAYYVKGGKIVAVATYVFHSMSLNHYLCGTV